MRFTPPLVIAGAANASHEERRPRDAATLARVRVGHQIVLVDHVVVVMRLRQATESARSDASVAGSPPSSPPTSVPVQSTVPRRVEAQRWERHRAPREKRIPKAGGGSAMIADLPTAAGRHPWRRRRRIAAGPGQEAADENLERPSRNCVPSDVETDWAANSRITSQGVGLERRCLVQHQRDWRGRGFVSSSPVSYARVKSIKPRSTSVRTSVTRSLSPTSVPC